MQRPSQHPGYLFSSRLIYLVAALLIAQFFLAASPSHAAALSQSNYVPDPGGVRFFKETGHNVSGLFLQNYYATGGQRSGPDRGIQR